MESGVGWLPCRRGYPIGLGQLSNTRIQGVGRRVASRHGGKGHAARAHKQVEQDADRIAQIHISVVVRVRGILAEHRFAAEEERVQNPNRVREVDQVIDVGVAPREDGNVADDRDGDHAAKTDLLVPRLLDSFPVDLGAVVARLLEDGVFGSVVQLALVVGGFRSVKGTG